MNWTRVLTLVRSRPHNFCSCSLSWPTSLRPFLYLTPGPFPFYILERRHLFYLFLSLFFNLHRWIFVFSELAENSWDTKISWYCRTNEKVATRTLLSTCLRIFWPSGFVFDFARRARLRPFVSSAFPKSCVLQCAAATVNIRNDVWAKPYGWEHIRLTFRHGSIQELGNGRSICIFRLPCAVMEPLLSCRSADGWFW